MYPKCGNQSTVAFILKEIPRPVSRNLRTILRSKIHTAEKYPGSYYISFALRYQGSPVKQGDGSMPIFP